MGKVVAYTVILLTLTVGFVSLSLQTLFLLLGPFGWIDLHLGARATLIWDAFLVLAFCVQHSVMVRRSFRQWMSAFVATECHGAIYTVASGIVLTAMVVLWQESHTEIVRVGPPLRWIGRAIFAAGILGSIWSLRSLGQFDSFGVRPILLRLRRSQPSEPVPMVVRGPYRRVRHPIYLFAILMAWSYPDLTSDRLVFNLVWTGWIWLGSVLEERDLVAEFGEEYREYQRNVPMLVPWRAPWPRT